MQSFTSPFPDHTPCLRSLGSLPLLANPAGMVDSLQVQSHHLRSQAFPKPNLGLEPGFWLAALEAASPFSLTPLHSKEQLTAKQAGKGPIRVGDRALPPAPAAGPAVQQLTTPPPASGSGYQERVLTFPALRQRQLPRSSWGPVI